MTEESIFTLKVQKKLEFTSEQANGEQQSENDKQQSKLVTQFGKRAQNIFSQLGENSFSIQSTTISPKPPTKHFNDAEEDENTEVNPMEIGEENVNEKKKQIQQRKKEYEDGIFLKPKISKHSKKQIPLSKENLLNQQSKGESNWTHYSLESTESLSEESNRKAAFDFIETLKERNNSTLENPEEEGIFQTVVSTKKLFDPSKFKSRRRGTSIDHLREVNSNQSHNSKAISHILEDLEKEDNTQRKEEISSNNNNDINTSHSSLGSEPVSFKKRIRKKQSNTLQKHSQEEEEIQN